MYDYLIVGAGLYGSIFAHEATKRGYKCLVIDKRSHVGGNCYTENMYGVNVHMYGPHIFHTNSKRVWDYMNNFTTFNNFIYRPKVYASDGKLYSFPINLMTLYQVYGVTTPKDAREVIEHERSLILNTDDLESWIISQVGTKLYDLFIKYYTTKQWNKDPKCLPNSIIKRLPIRYNFNDNYFNDEYQGIPIGGYTPIFNNLLKGSTVMTSRSFRLDDIKLASRGVIYTGPIDEFFEYRLGPLEYRGLKFTHDVFKGDVQGNAVINYAGSEPYTRKIEHKHFDNISSEYSILTTEYPDDWSTSKVQYYPIESDSNRLLYNQYNKLPRDSKIRFKGRLGEYRYYDMHVVIENALKDVDIEFGV